MDSSVVTAAPASRTERALSALLLLVLLVAAGRNALYVARHVVETPRLPQWDMARRGLEGVHLAEALRHGDVLGFLGHVNEASVWPPVFPLLEAPAFLAFGYGYEVPRLLVTLLFFLTVPALVWAGYHLEARRGIMVGLLAAGFFCASPFFQLYAGLAMLEVPGALLLTLCLGSYARALGSSSPGRWRLAWCLATVLFFCKYNYGLMWLGPLLLVETWRVHGTWSAFLRSLRKSWKPRPTSPTSPTRPERFRAWFGGLEPRHRQLIRWVVLPIAVWMLVPPHLRDFFYFVGNRSSGVSVLSWENLAFYPRALAHEFASEPGWGWLLLAPAFSLCSFLPRLDFRVRILGLALLCGSVAIVAHPYKLARFAATVAPLVWLSAAWGIVWGVTRASERLVPRRPRLVALAAVGVLMGATVAESVEEWRFGGGYVYHTVPRAVESVLGEVYQVARASERTVFLGTWNLLSPALLEWHLRARYPDLEPRRLPKTGREMRGLGPETVCSDFEGTDVFALDPIPGRRMHPLYRGFREEIAPLRPIYEALDEAGCFELAWAKAYPRSRYRLRLFRWKAGWIGASIESMPSIESITSICRERFQQAPCRARERPDAAAQPDLIVFPRRTD